MKKYVLLLPFLCMFLYDAICQQEPASDIIEKKVADSLWKERKDSLKFAKLTSLAYFPVIEAGTFSGVLPVDSIDEIPDPNRDYKLLFEFTYFDKDTSHKRLNPGLVEIARIINLHVASGIPLAHVHAVVVAHGSSLFSIENNKAYMAKYNKDNPNNKLLADLVKCGVKFVACGQAMKILDIYKAELNAAVKISLTAQVALSNYQMQGYALYHEDEEK